MAELRSLFKEAASEQWFPMAQIMAKAIKRVESESEARIPASKMVNIDLEFSPVSKEVLQIGLADLEGASVLDCHTRYSEGVIAPSSSRLPAPAGFPLKHFEKKVRALHSHDGTLDAKRIAGKLREIDISKKTIFLSWAQSSFDLSYLRDWLEAEGFNDVLPGNENVCLLLMEFRENVKRVLGRTRYRGRSFPLSLPVLFLLLFGENHKLSGCNHHAVVDAQQLALMGKLFIDLCKPPNKRDFWQGSDIKKLPLGKKRQRTLEEILPQTSSTKKARLS